MIKNLGLELQESVDKWQQLAKELEPYLPAIIPKSDASILQTSLSLLEEWASETEKQLNPLLALTKETLATSRQEPQSYKQLLEDLGNAEEIRKKEAAIIGEKALLQEKFGSRFKELETNWEDIVQVLEWTMKVRGAFKDIPISETLRRSSISRTSRRSVKHRIKPTIRRISENSNRF